MIKGIKSLRRIVTQHREQYCKSELYYFRYFKKVSKRKDPVKSIEALYRWIDQLDMDEPTLQYFAKTYGTSKLVREAELFQQHFNSGNTTTLSFYIKAWSEARNNYLKGKRQTAGGGQTLWINP